MKRHPVAAVNQTPKGPARSFLSAVFWNALLMTLALPVSVATAVIIGRVLGPAGKGEYTLATLLGGLLVAALNLGLPASVSYFISSSQAPAASVAKTLLVLAVVLGAAGLALATLLDRAGWCSYVLGIPRLTSALWLALLGAPFLLTGAFLQFVILALGYRVLFAALPALGQLAVSAGIAGLVLLGRLSAVSAVGAQVFSQVLTCGILLLYVQHKVDWWHAPLLRSPVWKSLVRYSGWSYAAQTMQFLVQRADVFLVSVFLGLPAVGLYSVAYGTAELLLLLPQRFGNLYLPRIAGDVALQQKAEEPAVSCSLVFVGTLASAVVLALIAPFAIRFFYGRLFAASVQPFLWLLPGVCAVAVSSIQSAYLCGVGKIRTTAVAAGWGLALNCALNLVFIPRYGISGAAVASSLAYGAQALLLMMAVARITRTRMLAMLISAPPALMAHIIGRAFRRTAPPFAAPCTPRAQDGDVRYTLRNH